MGFKIPKDIKNLDYSSPDCQCLIREYTKLICKMTKEYESLVEENKELTRRVEKLNSQLQIHSDRAQLNGMQSSTIASSFGIHDKSSVRDLLKKSFSSLQLYGWRLTLKKIFKKLFH